MPRKIEFAIQNNQSNNNSPIKIIYDNEDYYIGEVLKKMRDGDGRYISKSGFEISGKWANDRIKRGVFNGKPITKLNNFEYNKEGILKPIKLGITQLSNYVNQNEKSKDREDVRSEIKLFEKLFDEKNNTNETTRTNPYNPFKNNDEYLSSYIYNNNFITNNNNSINNVNINNIDFINQNNNKFINKNNSYENYINNYYSNNNNYYNHNNNIENNNTDYTAINNNYTINNNSNGNNLIISKKKEYPEGIYVGQLLNNVREGEGTFTYRDGTQISGKWENDSLHYGTFIDVNKAKYIGHLLNGKPHAHSGDFYSADGVHSYRGGVINGILHGLGIYTDPQTKIEYQITWDKGVGIYTDPQIGKRFQITKVNGKIQSQMLS